MQSVTLFFFFLCLIACELTAGNVDMSRCVRNCKRKRSGDYQSCHGCHVFCSCVWGRLIDNRPCPANSQWDDIVKRCVLLGHSATCNPGFDARTAFPPTPVTGPDVSPPTPVTGPGGERQPTNFTCPPVNGGGATTPRPTEGTGTTRPGQCITTCSGMRNGDYQSCYGCENQYASCYFGTLFDRRPCSHAVFLVWNDHTKRCVWPYDPNTCHGPIRGYDPDATTPSTATVPSPQQNVCSMIRSTVNDVTVRGCVAPSLVQTRCHGECPSHFVYTGITDEPDSQCMCCKPTGTEVLHVDLDCRGQGQDRRHTYTVATGCSCDECS